MTTRIVYDRHDGPEPDRPTVVGTTTDGAVALGTITLGDDGHASPPWRRLSPLGARQLAAELLELADELDPQPTPEPSLVVNRQGPPRALRNPAPSTPAMRAADRGPGSYTDSLELEQLAAELHAEDTAHLGGALPWELLPMDARERYRGMALSTIHAARKAGR